MRGLFRVLRDLPFEDIIEGKISHPTVYQRQTQAWFLTPAKSLGTQLENSDAGIALLALLLLFFEPHGQYLTATSGNGTSTSNFKAGFSRFATYLKQQSLMDSSFGDDEIKKFYKWARCGIMHSGTLSRELLVDSIHALSGRVVGRHFGFSGWLVSPWDMLPALEKYVAIYVGELELNKPLRENFESTFEKLVLEPGKHFIAQTFPRRAV